MRVNNVIEIISVTHNNKTSFDSLFFITFFVPMVSIFQALFAALCFRKPVTAELRTDD